MAIITNLKLQKDKNRVNVYLDGEFVCGMEMSVILKNGLKIGCEIQEERLMELQSESEFNRVYEKALRLLDRQKYTKFALKTKLKSKSYDEDIIDDVCRKLMSLGLVCDVDFAQSYIHSVSNKSKKEIENMLIQKGVSDKDIAIAMSESEIDDEEIATKLAEKFMRYKEASYENKLKLKAYLYRKGFGYSLIEKVVDLYN